MNIPLAESNRVVTEQNLKAIQEVLITKAINKARENGEFIAYVSRHNDASFNRELLVELGNKGYRVYSWKAGLQICWSKID